jgi:hypothetical protein
LTCAAQPLKVWEINEADIQLIDALYTVAREAMRRGYYMPNRGSIHCSRHQCPHWRRCELDFGGVVEARGYLRRMSRPEICIAVNRFHRFPRWNEKAGFQRDALRSQ